MPCTSRLMSTDFTSSGCWRENASRRCTSVAARSAAWRAIGEPAAHALLAVEAAQREVEIADDRGEQIVEVVRDAAGEPADRLHLLRLAQRFLGRLAPRDLLRAASRWRRPRAACGAAPSGTARPSRRSPEGRRSDGATCRAEPGSRDIRRVDAGRHVDADARQLAEGEDPLLAVERRDQRERCRPRGPASNCAHERIVRREPRHVAAAASG